MSNDGGYTLIDPPVGPFSTREAIEAWIDQLRGMEPGEEVDAAIAQAEGWLKLRDELEAESGGDNEPPPAAERSAHRVVKVIPRGGKP